MVDYQEDTGAYPAMVELAAQTQQQIADRGLTPIDKVTVQSGNTIVADYVNNGKDCGEIIVNLAQAYPTNPFPEQMRTASRLGKAGAACGLVMGYEIQVTVLRCAPVMNGTKSNPTPPTTAQQLSSARDQMADMQAMRSAICQAMNNLDRDYFLGAYTPTGPDGGVVGGTWDVVVADKVEGEW